MSGLTLSQQLPQNGDNNLGDTKITGFESQLEEFSFNQNIDYSPSTGSFPHLVARNEFKGSQFNYSFSPTPCDDPSSETLPLVTSPTVTTGQEFAFSLSPDGISQYYVSSAEQGQSNGVPVSLPELTHFVNDNISLVLNLNAHYSHGVLTSVPMQNSGVDNQTITSTQGTVNHLPFEYTQNQVLLNSAQINSLPSTTSPQQSQPQSNQSRQIQQLIKCPWDDCSHSPARSHQCPICLKSFSRRPDLQRHIRVHTGVKPYQCPCCHKAFSRTDSLRRHLKTVETCKNSSEAQNMKVIKFIHY